jgi:hypothetical protein
MITLKKPKQRAAVSSSQNRKSKAWLFAYVTDSEGNLLGLWQDIKQDL